MTQINKFLEFAMSLDPKEWEITEHEYPKDKSEKRAHVYRSIRIKQRNGYTVWCYEFKDGALDYIDIGGIRSNAQQSGFLLGKETIEPEEVDDLC